MYAIVTGANSGLGLETTRELYRQGYTQVVLACRSEARANEAIQDIIQSVPDQDNCELKYMHLDLLDFASVNSFVDAYVALGCPLDLLVNNAGLMVIPPDKKIVHTQGYQPIEYLAYANHFGHFLMTLRLLPLMAKHPPLDGKKKRIVVLSSAAHAMGDSFTTLKDINRSESGFKKYGRSKSMNLHFAKELARRVKASELPIVVNAVHPGGVNTNLFKRTPSRISRFFLSLMSWMFLTPAKGARTQVYVATSPDVEGITGKYWAKCREKAPKAHCQDEKTAEALFRLSVEAEGYLVHY